MHPLFLSSSRWCTHRCFSLCFSAPCFSLYITHSFTSSTPQLLPSCLYLLFHLQLTSAVLTVTPPTNPHIILYPYYSQHDANLRIAISIKTHTSTHTFLFPLLIHSALIMSSSRVRDGVQCWDDLGLMGNVGNTVWAGQIYASILRWKKQNLMYLIYITDENANEGLKILSLNGI